MTTIERIEPQTGQEEIAVAIVDTDVHPLPVSPEVLKSYAPADWVDKIWPTGNAVNPVPHFYDTPDSYKTNSLRVDAAPPEAGFAGRDPDYAAKQLLVDARARSAPAGAVRARQRGGSGTGGAGRGGVGGTPLHGAGIDDAADSWNPFRQPAF